MLNDNGFLYGTVEFSQGFLMEQGVFYMAGSPNHEKGMSEAVKSSKRFNAKLCEVKRNSDVGLPDIGMGSKRANKRE